MAQAIQAYIGLGSNLENPREQVMRAAQEIDAIDGVRLIQQSRWYQSKAVGPGVQPDYINGVVLIETHLDAHALLDQLQRIEQEHERVRKIHWGPRTLDLDLLLFADHTIQTDRLTVPHAYLTERNFVLYPLADIAKDLVLPSGEALESLLAHCSNDGLHPIQD
ncbi:MAG: 2-amino-4-hydroxy-6-hydroxymethyldihydropteridine diphosphokinase [Cellvibrionaceae bacterium]